MTFTISDVIIPGVWSVETSLLLLIAGSLVARSVSDIWLIQNVTVIESTIINMDRAKFKSVLLKYCASLPLVSVAWPWKAAHILNQWSPLTRLVCLFFLWNFTDCRHQQRFAMEHRRIKIKISSKFVTSFVQSVPEVSSLDSSHILFTHTHHLLAAPTVALLIIKCPIWITEYRMPINCWPPTLTNSAKASPISIRTLASRCSI